MEGGANQATQEVKKALKTYLINYLLTVKDWVLYEHIFYQSWNSFSYFTCKIAVCALSGLRSGEERLTVNGLPLYSV